MALGDLFDSSQFIVKIWNTLLGEVCLLNTYRGSKDDWTHLWGKNLPRAIKHKATKSGSGSPWRLGFFRSVAVYFLCSYYFPKTSVVPICFPHRCVISPSLKKTKEQYFTKGV